VVIALVFNEMVPIAQSWRRSGFTLKGDGPDVGRKVINYVHFIQVTSYRACRHGTRQVNVYPLQLSRSPRSLAYLRYWCAGLFSKDTSVTFWGHGGEVDRHTFRHIVVGHVDDVANVGMAEAAMPGFEVWHMSGVVAG
jgi:hypothetical protein